MVLCVNLQQFNHADDDHRISLVPLTNFPEYQNDYINASYVDVSTALMIHSGSHSHVHLPHALGIFSGKQVYCITRYFFESA